MHRFYISVPVWGERCVDLFCATALPAIERAAKHLETDVRLVVHTDQPDIIKRSATEIQIDVRPLPAGLRSFDCLSQAHREVINMASFNDRICFLTADLIVSESTFVFCDNRLADGKMLITCACIRALQEGLISEGDTSSGERLSKWAWDNAHPITKESVWPNGKINDLSRVYFEKDHNVIARWCLPHPICIKKDARSITFFPTVDANLMQNYDRSEIHMVTNTQQLAIVELSPRDKDFAQGTSSIHDKWYENQIAIDDPLQLWMLEHKIVLLGSSIDCDDEEYVKRILER